VVQKINVEFVLSNLVDLPYTELRVFNPICGFPLYQSFAFEGPHSMVQQIRLSTKGSDQRPEVKKTTQPFLIATAFSFLDDMPQGNCNSVQNCTLFELRTENSAPSLSEKGANAADDGPLRSCVWLAFSLWLPLLFIRGVHGFAHVDTKHFPHLVLPAWTNQPIYLPATRLNDIGATRGSVTHL
jgi:hypothetical protein